MPSYRTPKLIDPKAQSRRETTASKLGTAKQTPPQIEELRQIVPFDQYAFSGLDYKGLGIGAGVMLGSDMPEGFLQAFLERGLYSKDPMSYLITPNEIWGSWHDLAPPMLAQPELQNIRALEMTYGVSTRSIVAFYRGDFRYGGATFTRNRPFDRREKFILEVAARLIHSDLSSAFLANMTLHSGLTPGELACLGAVARGLSAEAASREIGFTVETLNTYIKSAAKKLGAANRTHAVAEAMRRKVID